MRVYTEVGYVIYDNVKLYKEETIGLMHVKAINNSAIKRFLKKGLEKDKKDFKINLINKQMMSEEDAFKRYGNNLIDVGAARRMR